MFLFRSAFWLTIGFLVVAPHGTNFGAVASDAKDQAIAASIDAGQMMVSQIITKSYSSSALLDVRSPSVAIPMQDSTATAVFPRPRPAAMG